MHKVGPLAAEARPVRNRGHRVKHDSRMLDRPQRPVYRCPGASTRTRFGGRLVSALIVLRRASQDSAPCRHRRRVHHAAAFEARPSRMPANAIAQLVPDERPSPARADDRTLSSRPVSVRPRRRSPWWRAYRRLMVAGETPLEHLSHGGSDDSRSSRRRHCPVKSGTDNGN